MIDKPRIGVLNFAEGKIFQAQWYQPCWGHQLMNINLLVLVSGPGYESPKHVYKIRKASRVDQLSLRLVKTRSAI